MQVSTYAFTPTELQNAANTVKDVVLAALELEGAIQNATSIAESYAVVVVERGWFGKVLDRLFNVDKGALQFRVMKVVDRPPAAAPSQSVKETQ
jgi:hypothetical protein